MPIDRFLIAPYDEKSGLRTDLKPWLIPDEAFERLDNAYVFRGRVRKRFGSRWLGETQQATRLRINVGEFRLALSGAGIGITTAAGAATGTVPNTVRILGQRFIIGIEQDVVSSAAAGAQPMTQITGTSVTHTFNFGTGAYVFAGAPALTQIYILSPAVTSAAGSIAGFVPGAPFTRIGQQFSIGDVIFTVNALGTPAALLVCGGSATTATFNTTTGEFNFVGVLDGAGVPVAGIDTYFYPALPVMGLRTYEQPALENEITIAFDTKYAYQYINGGWERLAVELTPGAATWTGDNSQFFWTASFGGANAFDPVFFVTNFNETEPNFMRVYNGAAWDNFRPLITATTTLDSALILVPFKNRLLAFNTWENEAGTLRHYPFRMRYAAVGSALSVDAWRQDIPGKGSGLDCPTNENVVTVEFIRDRLIVFMETSTWEIAYTGNQIFPFAWQQINTELGAESTFSVVPMDKVAIGVGNVGIHSCNGTNVERIDSSIPEAVFDIHNNDAGVERVYGIRDYFVEMIYWTFPDTMASAVFPYPKRVLVFNYKTGTWSFNDDSFTCFGYFQPQTGILWDSTTITWDDDIAWNSGSVSALFRNVIAGNQQGWTFLIDADIPLNASSLQITNITILPGNIVEITSIDFNLNVGDFIEIEDVESSGNLDLMNFKVFKVTFVDLNDPDKFRIAYQDEDNTVLTGAYEGCGVIRRVSRIDILTKEYNFYVTKGYNAYVSKVDFQVDRTGLGQMTVDYYVSTNLDAMIAESIDTNTITGTNILETTPYLTIPFEGKATRLVHPIYFQADGEFIQLQITMSDEQMELVLEIEEGDFDGPAFQDFQLHSMTFFAQPSSSRMQ